MYLAYAYYDLAYAYYDLAYAYCDLVHAYFPQKWRTLMKISICQIQAYYIPTYLDFSHADLEYADFSQSKKRISQGPAVFW